MGTLFTPGVCDDLYDKLYSVLTDSELYEKLKEQCSSLKQKYSSSVTTNNIVSEFENLIHHL